MRQKCRNCAFSRQKCCNCTFSRQKCRNCTFSQQNSVCLGSSLSVRSFPIEEPGSPVPALYATLVQLQKKKKYDTIIFIMTIKMGPLLRHDDRYLPNQLLFTSLNHNTYHRLMLSLEEWKPMSHLTPCSPSSPEHRPGPPLLLCPPRWPGRGPRLLEATSGWLNLFIELNSK